AAVVGVQVNILEILVGIIGGDVGGFGNGGIHPFLRRGLDIHVLLGADVLGGNEIRRQPFIRLVGLRQSPGIDQFAVGQQFKAEYVHFFLALLALADHV